MKKILMLLLSVLLFGFFLGCNNDEPEVVVEPDAVDYLLGEEYKIDSVSIADNKISEILQTGVWQLEQSCLYDSESKKLLSRKTYSSYYKFNNKNLIMVSSDKDGFEENPNYVYDVKNKHLIMQSKNSDGTEIDYYTIVRIDVNSIVMDYDSVAYLNAQGDTLYHLSRKNEEIFRMRFISLK